MCSALLERILLQQVVLHVRLSLPDSFPILATRLVARDTRRALLVRILRPLVPRLALRRHSDRVFRAAAQRRILSALQDFTLESLGLCLAQRIPRATIRVPGLRRVLHALLGLMQRKVDPAFVKTHLLVRTRLLAHRLVRQATSLVWQGRILESRPAQLALFVLQAAFLLLLQRRQCCAPQIRILALLVNLLVLLAYLVRTVIQALPCVLYRQ